MIVINNPATTPPTPHPPQVWQPEEGSVCFCVSKALLKKFEIFLFFY